MATVSGVKLQKDGVQEFQKEMDAMKVIADAMKKSGTGAIISSSKAAKDARNKGSSTLTNEDILDTYEITIRCLEEEYIKAVEELKGFEKLIKSDSSCFLFCLGRRK